jgi:NAD(P)-dependent dehydrogenase (short-subunit alcohol dehydrogenase family)
MPASSTTPAETAAPGRRPASGRRVALVTGGARRIGRAIVLELARHGWDVGVHGHASMADAEATAQIVRDLGGRAQVLRADLSDEAQCEALLPALQAGLGRVDAVINNASLFEHDDVASFSVAAMERHWRANTAPAIVLARALHTSLQAGPTRETMGCVVNLLDQKLWNPNPDHLSYTLSKAALQSATTLLAQALAPRVRVCGVAPGVTLLSGDMTAAEFERARHMTPLERSSTPEDVARTVRFLLESPAITGTTVLVDGGQHLQAQPRDVLFLARSDAAA